MKLKAETVIEGGKRLEFEFLGEECILCIPDSPLSHRTVIWRAEFFGAFDGYDTAMFKKGYYRAYIKLSNMFGCPKAVEKMKKFHDYLVSEFGLNPRTVLVGLSRGGLYSANYAAKYPEDVAVLYLDAPVLSVANWPFGKGRTERNEQEVQFALGAYNMTEEQILQSQDHPLCKAELIAKQGTPVIFVCGGSDTVVDLRDNTEAFIEKFKAAGGKYEYYVKPDCGHHPHGLEDPTPVIEFTERIICG